jgi:hypothetical protein
MDCFLGLASAVSLPLIALATMEYCVTLFAVMRNGWHRYRAMHRVLFTGL